MKIGIVLIATNSYIILAVRFIKRFTQFYKGNAKITFYVFTDENIHIYLPDNINVVYIETHHNDWVDATNSKFSSILSIENYLSNEDFNFYFDADTNIIKDFTEEWFLGNLVGGQHYADQSWMKEKKNFDRNPISKSYVPYDTVLPQMYFYGAFFGGTYKNMVEFCKIMRYNQLEDKKIPYEPGVNDESYINQYFHFNPPTKVVKTEDFSFVISDKGGIGETRNVGLNVDEIKKQLLSHKDQNIDIQWGQVVS